MTNIVLKMMNSVGEKQRLAIARLVHHKPRFAILDECSSAITSEMVRFQHSKWRFSNTENEDHSLENCWFWGDQEERLYKICDDWNITYITIAHRPVLRAYHDISLGNSSFWIENSSFWIENSSFWIENSSFWIENSSFWMQNSSFWIRKHDVSLAIGDGNQGWKIEKIDGAKERMRAKIMSKVRDLCKQWWIFYW